MRNHLLSTIALFGILACAAGQKPARSSKAGGAAPLTLRAKDGTVLGGTGSKGKYACEMETGLGTHVAQRVCRYIDDTEDSIDHREQTQQGLQTHNVCASTGDTGHCASTLSLTQGH